MQQYNACELQKPLTPPPTDCWQFQELVELFCFGLFRWCLVMERNIFGQHEGVNAIIPILKFAENDGSSPYKFVSADDLRPFLCDPFIEAARCIYRPPPSVPYPANHPDTLIVQLMNDFVPAIDALVAEGARASTTGQWRRDLVLQVSKGLRAVSAVLDDGAPQRGLC